VIKIKKWEIDFCKKMQSFFDKLKHHSEMERLWAVAEIDEKSYSLGYPTCVIKKLNDVLKKDDSPIVRAAALRAFTHEGSEECPITNRQYDLIIPKYANKFLEDKQSVEEFIALTIELARYNPSDIVKKYKEKYEKMISDKYGKYLIKLKDNDEKKRLWAVAKLEQLWFKCGIPKEVKEKLENIAKNDKNLLVRAYARKVINIQSEEYISYRQDPNYTPGSGQVDEVAREELISIDYEKLGINRYRHHIFSCPK
jgi:hypothetical protein